MKIPPNRVTCLGRTFESDEERKTFFRALLEKRLQSKAFRQLPGFPVAEDEAIIALSDPPFFTACPNPWLSDFILEWQNEKMKPVNGHGGRSATPDHENNVSISTVNGHGGDSATPDHENDMSFFTVKTINDGGEALDGYERKPFTADVREGRSGLFYDAHSYHTKVPHKAIMRYILHYTEPGDVVFDGFCGTGMTGVAAQMCGDHEMVESLGYRVEKDGTVLQLARSNRSAESLSFRSTERLSLDSDGKRWRPFSKLGVRRAILNDISPAAAFIAYNYNTPIDAKRFEDEAKRILDAVEDELGWMYETRHTDGNTVGRIHYTVWSDLFLCPACGREVLFWDEAVDLDRGKIRKTFPCPHCRALLGKQKMARARVRKFDPALDREIDVAKLVPVLINYSLPGSRQRFEKRPDPFDLDLIDKIESCTLPYPYPIDELPDGFNTRQPRVSHGITHVHHFYTRRNLLMLAALREKAKGSPMAVPLSFLINSYDLTHSTLMTRLIFKGQYRKPVLTGYQSGTLYVSSLPVEKNLLSGIRQRKLSIMVSSLKKVTERQVVSCSGSQTLEAPDASVDYIFVDPPFGGNIMYSELNFLLEAWQKVTTNNRSEAIQNSVHGKSLSDYEGLMQACFAEAFRLLKPGRWITVEFSNTQASVWNSIQSALTEVGFIIADVSALDKKQGSFKAVTTTTAAKQDLVISAYKPNVGLTTRQKIDATSTEADLWEFVREHLKRLPEREKRFDEDGAKGGLVSERDPRILYNQVVAFFVKNGRTVPLSTQGFQEGLASRFSIQNGQVFLS